MESAKRRILAAISILIRIYAISAEQCSTQDCVKMADPLLTEPNLIFPDKMVDIDDLCRRWRQFVQCVKDYTTRCFTEAQQRDFIKAVESPVDLVHQMCTEPQYQLEYLQHASCIQATITSDGRCKQNYRQLVELVLGDVDQNNLCCSHHNFHECVVSEVKRRCNLKDRGDSAIKFTRQILDKALSFLQARCHDYDYKSGDCSPRFLPDSANNGAIPGNNSDSNREKPSDAATQYRGTTNAMTVQHQPQPQDAETPPFWLSSQNTEHHVSSSPNRPLYTNSAESVQVNSRDSSFQRNSSYGRGISWPSSNPQASDVQTQSQDVQHTSLYSTWKASSNGGTPNVSTTEPWYPSVLNHRGKINNDVDEPNQQGLANDNSGGVSSSQYSIVTLMAAFGVVAITM